MKSYVMSDKRMSDMKNLLLTTVICLCAAALMSFVAKDSKNLSKTTQTTTWTTKVVQGFNMRVWLANKLVMGIEAWDVDAAPRIPLPPHYGLEYPTGSGNEHLFGGGPRIGGIVNGSREISWAYNGTDASNEFFPVYEHIQRYPFWHTQTGVPPHEDNGWSGYYYNHGIVTNTRGCDDDHDGKVDEDDLDGLDNDGDWNLATDDVGSDGLPDSLEVSCDGQKYDPVNNPDPAQDDYNPVVRDHCHPNPDGTYPFKNNPDIWTERNGIPDHGEPHVDEDYGAVSDKDYYCTAQDVFDFPTHPDGHKSIGIRVIQKSYAWQGSFADGILPFEYTFINIGKNVIKDVYVGFFADMDVGPISDGNYPTNDYACYIDSLRTAYIHNPVDGGATPLGITVLKTPRPLDSLEYIFHWFPNAGDDPTDDSTAYAYLSGEAFPGQPIEPCQSPAALSDTRFYFSFGKFNQMNPGDSLKIALALVSGYSVDQGPGNMRENAENVIKLFGRGYTPPVLPQSPSLKVTQGFKKVDLVWGDSAGPIDPTTVWDDSNKLAQSYPDTSWRRINPPCGANSSGCAAHQCTIVNGKPFLPGGRIFEGYRLYRSEDPSDPPLQSSFTLLGQFDLPDDNYGFNTGVISRFSDTNLVRGKTYWYSVTTFGIPDIQLIPIKRGDGSVTFDTLLSANAESPITQNMVKVVLPFSTSDRLNQVLVVPNPYRVDQDYTYENGGWEGRARDWTENSRLIKFIHLPSQCTIRVFSLTGDLIATLPFTSPIVTDVNNNRVPSNIGELSWDILSDSHRALASGVYIFTVESEFGTQVGKFVLIR